ncbi:hypothetical protein ZOSMA_54G00310 [Zostera marina]|uniref:Zinc-ribbon 15 domain-containing protein n=1 Tax=Zostera marina TaxID=29655 RepID=A0A0K9NYP5_ZOSMR|nr:hypothetical protein ZOSMA_54G00310 [Zostera marina]
MFFFFVGGLEERAARTIKTDFTRCIRCGSSSTDLVETEKVLKLFFIPVWNWPGNNTAVRCRDCSFLFHPPPFSPPPFLRCNSCNRMVDGPDYIFCPFCGSPI